MNLTRREFVRRAALAAGMVAWEPMARPVPPRGPASPTPHPDVSLPAGSAPLPVHFPHFPDRFHAFVWRNWGLVPTPRMAKVVGATPTDILRAGQSMGLPKPQPVPRQQWDRSYLTLIRRNWHLLPYDQLLELLDWTVERLAFTLREDDFFWIKLGQLKPRCRRLRFQPPDAATQTRARAIAAVLGRHFPRIGAPPAEPLFHFVGELSSLPSTNPRSSEPVRSAFAPRFCYSYFALYGDPLLEPAADPYPEGLLQRLSNTGVDGIWLQAVLYKLARFPWEPRLSQGHETRLKNLRALVDRANRQGQRVYLYLNEPRAMPLSFFKAHPELKGVVEGDHAALCTSVPAVQDYLRESVAAICRAVPGLGGFFTITASENLTNCWSHGGGAGCPRCRKRPPAAVIAEVNRVFHQGIQAGGASARLMVWDWGWAEPWVPDIIERLPLQTELISVSEWGIPTRRGGIPDSVGEYSISVIGPGERAKRHWDLARRRGLKTIAKIQASNSWELSAVPYIPALENVAQHAANLLATGVDGLMLSWTLGGYPSPNLEMVATVAALGAHSSRPNSDAPESSPPLKPVSEGDLAAKALQHVALRRFGPDLAAPVVKAWRGFSAAFRQFPFDASLVYHAPLQCGPSNLLWGESTGYRATMVGFPYDDLQGWRSVYPVDVFVAQFQKLASGFEATLAELRHAFDAVRPRLSPPQARAAQRELNVAEAAGIHFRTTANQARFVQARDQLNRCHTRKEGQPWIDQLNSLLQDEIALAQRLYQLQRADSRVGFEASNQYYYVPLDLAEKVVNAHYLLDHWLPGISAKLG